MVHQATACTAAFGAEAGANAVTQAKQNVLPVPCPVTRPSARVRPVRAQYKCCTH